MKLKSTLLIILLLTIATFADTNISGSISHDSTITSAGNPYIVTGNLTVESGVTLTIESGVILKFNSGIRLYVLGTLNAQSAVFTSVKATPSPGDWGDIVIGNYYHSGSATFNNCEIKYAGRNDYSNIYVDNGELNLKNSYVSYSKNNGVSSKNRNNKIVIENTTISNCEQMGVSVETNNDIVITNSIIQSCKWPIEYFGSASVVFNGINNFGGNTHDGIFVRNRNYTTMVWDTVNIPYVLNQDFVLQEGDTLTIAPGNVIKANRGTMYIDGALIAQGTSTNKIYFTSYKNDNLFGDTNNDGSTSSPAISDWGGITFRDASDDAVNVMKYCSVSFAGRGYSGGVNTENASPTIQYCDLSNNYYGAKFVGLSSPDFSHNTIGTSQMVPVAMSFEANPVFNDNSFSNSDNEFDAIGILGGTLKGDAVLPQRDFTSVSNVTYLLLGSVTVPSGITLTINKGIVIKSYYYSHRIRIEGKLVAEGTASEPIVFTSAKDDSYGNPFDTNKDGTTTVPKVEDWSGIVFKNGSDPSSVMNHCIVKFAALSWYEDIINNRHIYDGAITLINSSPTISNTKITDSHYGIFAFASSNPVIDSCRIENSKYTPILMSANANPTFTNNEFVNVGYTALGICDENLPTDAEIMQRNVAGYNNITYMVMGNLTINSGANLTVDPGVVIKFYDHSNIFVAGGFKAVGTATSKIVFSSKKDDNIGNPGDTNGDGDASSPERNDWGAIKYLDTSDDGFSAIEYCEIKYSGYNYNGGVSYESASARINNTLISDSYYGVRCDGNSSPTIGNLKIQNCEKDPIAMSLKSNPTFSNIEFSANGSKGIRILEGVLSSDATLAKRSIAGFSNIAYIVENLEISSNAVLTIEPGVVIKFNRTCCLAASIVVKGALIANGTTSEKIIFTSIRDDSNGGDTNNDGNNSAPGKGDWKSITFHSSTLDSLNSLKNCEVRYSGSLPWSYEYDGAAIIALSAKVKIDSTIIEQSYSAGVGIYGSASPVITNCDINNIRLTPITLSMFSTPTFSGNRSLNVGIMAIGVKPENYSVDGTVPVRNFAGYSNITYYLYGVSTVNSGTEITIPAGIVFKGGGLEVKGKLLINGSGTNPVVFTALKDDSFGNPMDTNGDGTSSSPDRRGTRIKFFDVSDDGSKIENAIFCYSENAVHIDQASPTIKNTKFMYDEWGLILSGVSKPSLTDCTFEDLSYAPFRTSLVSYPAVTSGNVIKGTTFKAIGVLESETLVQDVTLPKRNFAGITNIPYLFGNYTVASNAVLTIEPGVVLKFFRDVKLTVKKGLIAKGGATSDSNIVFTYYKDDFYGGDLNSDSTASSPGNEGWGGLRFEDESLDPLCVLDHVVIQYTTSNYWQDNAGIATINASPTITHSILRKNTIAILAKGSSNPVVHYCDIYDNKDFGIKNVDKSFVINAEYNWWGSNSGPTHSSNPSGTGQTVSDAVDFTPWLGSGASNPIMGDVSLNGVVQAYDASKILKYLVNPTGPDSLNATQRNVADVSGNAGITAYDASLILQYSVGLISFFPAEANNSPLKIDKGTKKYLALQKVGSVGLHLDGTKASFGKDFTVPVNISNVDGITALQIEIAFNSKLYSLNGVELNTEFADYNMNYALNENKDKLTIVIAGTKIMQKEGNLLNINLHVAEDLRGEHSEALTVKRFLANETDLTKEVNSDAITFVGKPTKYTLQQNYPNPFSKSGRGSSFTTISYKIPNDNVGVKLTIYNIQGKEVKTLVNTRQNAGTYKIRWDGTNNRGYRVSSGIYIYRITTKNFTATKKMMLIK